MLTTVQKNGFRETLQRRFREVREAIRQALLQSDDEHYVALAGRVHDMEEEAVADLLVDVSLADIDRHIEELRDIDAALGRIATASYGVCSDCGADIEVARLEAYPTARRCRPCQQRYEERRPASAHSTSL